MIPRLSISGLSILFALLLAVWEVYFFGFAGHRVFGALEGTLGWFTPDRLGPVHKAVMRTSNVMERDHFATSLSSVAAWSKLDDRRTPHGSSAPDVPTAG
jgi:hypothetical protein